MPPSLPAWESGHDPTWPPSRRRAIGVSASKAASLPPVVLSFLAPAVRCNQRCPACILDQIGEPVSEVGLAPADYGLFVEQFVEAKVPIRSVTFQGYEVTLPASWPYLEVAFAVAREHEVARDFITNGMLLHKWTDRVEALDPQRISVSLDGSDPQTTTRSAGSEGRSKPP